MSRFRYYAALLAASLVAGCASAPEQSAGNGAGGGQTEGAAVAGQSAQIAPSAVIDLNAQVDDSASTVICRDMLKQGSNVIVTTCMTRANWKAFERHQERDAQQIVRMLQGSAYR